MNQDFSITSPLRMSKACLLERISRLNISTSLTLSYRTLSSCSSCNVYVFLAAEEQTSPKEVEASAAVASNEGAEAVQAIGIVSQHFIQEDQTDRRPTAAEDAGEAVNSLQINVENAAAMGITAVSQDEVTPSPTAPGNPCTPKDPLTGTVHDTQVDCSGELDIATAG